MEIDATAIGSRLMETITDGLYNGNLNCLREYVQNSIDAHAKNIAISIEKDDTMVIEDDGDGMSENQLRKSIYLGISDKTDKDVGWRGIGIWSGVPGCQKIVIITKKKNDSKYMLTIDCNIIRKNNRSNRPLIEVIDEATKQEPLELGKKEKEDTHFIEDVHFTKVRLEQLMPQQKILHDKKKICEYLSKEVPAPFNESKFSFAKDINNWLEEKGVVIQDVNITFEGDKIYRNPTRSNIYLPHVTKKPFIVKGETVAVAWIITLTDNQKLRGNDKINAGIFLKKKGFTLGDANTVENQYDGIFNRWQYGEIHILSNDFFENAARNDLERTSSKVNEFLEQVGEYIGHLQGFDRKKSETTSSKELKKAEKEINKGNFDAASKLLEKASTHLSRETPDIQTDKSLEPMKKVLEEESKKEREKYSQMQELIKQKKPQEAQKVSALKTNKERLNAIIDSLPELVKKNAKEKTPKGYLNPEHSVMEPLVDLLKKKTGLQTNELSKLSELAYGWNNINPSPNGPPLLAIDNKKGKLAHKRNMQFGVMIQATNDLFVNLYKHERDKKTFKWYKGASKEEQYEIAMGMYAMIGMIYRLIVHSEKYNPK